MYKREKKILSLIMAIAMITALLPIGLTVTAATPGNITNLVTKYTGNTTTYAATGAVNAGLVAVASNGLTPTAVAGATNDEKIANMLNGAAAGGASVPLGNPYYTGDKSVWMYGDRYPNAPGGSGASDSGYYNACSYTILNNSSPILLGAGTTKILALNSEKNFVTAIPDLYSFDIDKPATVYVFPRGSYDTQFVTNYGWTKSTSLTLNSGSAPALQYSVDSKYYSVPSGGSGNIGNPAYLKHFTAGTVNIPSRGASGASNGYVMFVVWDVGGTGDTSLSALSYNDGTDHNLTIVPNKTVYYASVAAGSVPVVSAAMTETEGDITINQATGVPGTATINVISSTKNQTYTIYFNAVGSENIYVEKTDISGSSGIARTPMNLGFPTAPAIADISGSTLNSGNASSSFWNFNDGNGDVNVSRCYSNYGAQAAAVRYQTMGVGGSGFWSYVKLDISSLDPSRSIQQALLTIPFTGGGTIYAGNNKNLYIEISEVPETNWYSGSYNGDINWTGTAPNKAPSSTNLKFFPLVNKSGAIVSGSGDVSVPYPLTWASVPDNSSSLIPAIKNAAYTTKLTTSGVGTMVTSGSIGTGTFDVTKSVISKLAAGAKTATFRVQIAPYIYGYSIGGTQVDMSFNITDTGATRPKLSVTSVAAGTPYVSSESKLAYITIGDKAKYSTQATSAFTAGHSPIDLGASFDPAVTTQQTISVPIADLNSGKISLNAFAKDASATVSINGATAAAGFQSAAITPVQGVATASVVVTAPNATTLTYDLKFVVDGYVPSADSSLSSLTYTHSQLGTKSIGLVAGTTTYDVVLPYGISSEVPQIAGAVTNTYATIQSTTQALAVPGSASIVVKAENGTTSTYTVNFSVSQTAPVIDHQHGNVTNAKTRYQNNTTAYAVPTADDLRVRPVQGSVAVPVTKYDASTGYATNDERISAALAETNPYFTSDERAWTFGDRAITPDTATGASDTSVLHGNTQFAVVNTTSSFLLGDNVTKVLTRNDAKGFTLTIPDLYTFDISKSATIYVGCENNGAAMNTNFVTNNGWTKEISTMINRASVPYPSIKGSDGKYCAVPNGATNSAVVYSKHYIAGATVAIPSSGMTTSGGVVVYVVWDETNTNTTLSSLSVNGTGVTGFKPDTTAYTVELPYGTTQIPTVTATASFSGASAIVTDPASLPGSATVTITAADTVTTGTYTINYTVAKADPTVTWPTVGTITYGQTFADAISGGVGDGTFTIEDAAIVPDASATPYTKTITFTPNDTENFNTITSVVEITVNNASQSVPALNYTKTKTSITITPVEGAEYGLKLKSSSDEVVYGDITEFTNLTAGTAYTVYIRLTAKTNYDASAPTILDVTTDSDIAAGDVSGDGLIDISDVIMAAEIAVGVQGYTTAQIARANVSDKNNSTVDISDVVMIAERAVGGTIPFPVDVK